MVTRVEALRGWPGTVFEAVSPTAFRGLSVPVDFSGATVARVVGLVEWRGVPSATVLVLDGPPSGGGGGDPG